MLDSKESGVRGALVAENRDVLSCVQRLTASAFRTNYVCEDSEMDEGEVCTNPLPPQDAPFVWSRRLLSWVISA